MRMLELPGQSSNFHRLDRIVGVVNRLNLDKLRGMGQQELVDDFQLAFARPDGGERGHRALWLRAC